jgi:ribonuclease HI
MNIRKAVIYTDGAAVPNPGPAALGVIIKDEHGRLIASISQRIGQATNNQAEYRAIIAALEHAISLGINRVEVHSDSELVVKQINDKYRVKKTALQPLCQKVKQLQCQFRGFSITYIPRQRNTEADNLANKALNLVSHLPPAESYRLTIKLNQRGDENSDIAYLHKLIDILRDFPGQDEVSLCITNEVDERIFTLRLTNIHVNYCPELRKRLVEMVGKKRLVLKPI